MVDRAEYERWHEAAADARRGAVAQTEAGLHNWACFMAEQSAQLAIKGLLHAIGAGAWGHDLKVLEAALVAQLSESTPEPISAALGRLARHYIPTRYSDAQPGGPPARYYAAGDATSAITDADAIMAYLDAVWAALVREGEL